MCFTYSIYLNKLFFLMLKLLHPWLFSDERFFSLFFIIDTIRDVPISHPFPLSASTQSPCSLTSGHYHTIACICWLYTQIFLANPFTFFSCCLLCPLGLTPSVFYQFFIFLAQDISKLIMYISWFISEIINY